MIGESVKGFRIVSLLGRGGMGEVWMAEHALIKTRVAIKVLTAEASADAAQVDRFFAEAVAAGKIKHAGIVRINDVGFHDGRAFLIMELLDGESLGARMRRRGPLPLGDAIEIGRQLGSVLAATHAAGVVHRDLKPDNVMLVVDHELPGRERVKVLDFGIAKLGDRRLAKTAAGGPMGTPPYIAPEQWRDASTAGAPADVYSLGCLLFEIACGRPPFVTTTLAEACEHHLNTPPPAAHAFVLQLPAEVDELIASMLAKPVGARPTMTAVTAVLARHVPNAPITPLVSAPVAGPDPPPPTAAALPPTAPGTIDAAAGSTVTARPRARRPAMYAVAAIVAVGAAAAVVAETRGGADEPVRRPEFGLAAVANFHAPTPRTLPDLQSAALWQTARDDFAEACRASDADARWCAGSNFAAGELALADHDAATAAVALRRAAAADPSWADVDVALEEALSDQGDVDGALAAARTAQRLAPEWWLAIAAGARAYADAGRKADMVKEYHRALTLAPHDPVLLAEVAVAFHYDNLDTEADEYAAAANAADDAAPALHLIRAERALEAGNGKLALAEAERVLAVYPSGGAALLARGDAYALLGDKPRAYADYRRALAVVTPHQPAPRLQEVRDAMARDALPPPRHVLVVEPTAAAAPAAPVASTPASRPASVGGAGTAARHAQTLGTEGGTAGNFGTIGHGAGRSDGQGIGNGAGPPASTPPPEDVNERANQTVNQKPVPRAASAGSGTGDMK